MKKANDKTESIGTFMILSRAGTGLSSSSKAGLKFGPVVHKPNSLGSTAFFKRSSSTRAQYSRPERSSSLKNLGPFQL